MKNQITKEEATKVFEPHFLKSELERREKAISLFNEGNFDEIRRKYIHYYISSTKTRAIDSTSIEGVIKRLKHINDTLPANAHNVSVKSYFTEEEGILGSDIETGIEVSYQLINIEPIKKCESLAKCWARESAWKLVYQPNGKDGKRALETYNMLTKKIKL